MKHQRMSGRRILEFLALGGAVVVWLGGLTGCGAPARRGLAGKPNVLFIAVDDLRPELGCYDAPLVKSPNIDRLAACGVLFQRAYCQDSVCCPSRTSMLTGLRPDSTHIFDNSTHFRIYHPDAITLPEQFRLSGFHSVSMGKIYHSQWDHAYVGRRLDDPASWSEPSWFPPVAQFYFTSEGERVVREIYARGPDCRLDGSMDCLHARHNATKDLSKVNLADPRYDEWKKHFVMGLATEAPEVSDDALYDGQVAAHAIATLRRLKDQPFFMAVGFCRPHIPSVAPKRYWDLYDPSRIKLADNPRPPQGAPSWALPEGQDYGYYSDFPQKGVAVDDVLARRLIHGYYATISFMDAQVGRVLAELERLDLADNTIVVLWGDHGYHLGENAQWGKQTCYERANRQPLIVCAPGRKGNGRKSLALVEAVDIYPTLCELAGLPIPSGLEGTSMAPLLDAPDRPWKPAVFSQFPRPVRASVPGTQASPDDKMGYAMRTDRYRYVEWHYVMQPDRIADRELYDHQADPQENLNLAHDTDHAELIGRLHNQLQAGWRGSLPPQ